MAAIDNKSTTITTSKTVREFLNNCLGTTIYGEDITYDMDSEFNVIFPVEKKNTKKEEEYTSGNYIGDGSEIVLLKDEMFINYKANRVYTYFLKIKTGVDSETGKDIFEYGYATDCYWDGEKYIITYYTFPIVKYLVSKIGETNIYENVIGINEIGTNKPFTEWAYVAPTKTNYPLVRFDNKQYMNQDGTKEETESGSGEQNSLYFTKSDKAGTKVRTVSYADGYWVQNIGAAGYIEKFDFTPDGPDKIKQIIFTDENRSNITFEKVWTATAITATLTVKET